VNFRRRAEGDDALLATRKTCRHQLLSPGPRRTGEPINRSKHALDLPDVASIPDLAWSANFQQLVACNDEVLASRDSLQLRVELSHHQIIATG